MKHSSKDLHVQRNFNVPANVLFNAISTRQGLEGWWTVPAFKLYIVLFELKEDGVLLYYLEDDKHMRLYGKFVYDHIIDQHKLTYISSFCDDAGKIIRAPFNAEWPLEVENTWKISQVNPDIVCLEITATPYGSNDKEKAAFQEAIPKMEKEFYRLLDCISQYVGEVD